MQTTTSELASFVGSQVKKLQDSYVFGDRAGSAAALANLRRSRAQSSAQYGPDREAGQNYCRTAPDRR